MYCCACWLDCCGEDGVGSVGSGEGVGGRCLTENLSAQKVLPVGLFSYSPMPYQPFGVGLGDSALNANGERES